MQLHTYDELSSYTYQQVCDLCAKEQSFKVVAGPKIGNHITKFLKSYAAYRSRPRSIASRFAFLIGARHGFLIPGFMPIWNRAIMDGYLLLEPIETTDGFEVQFVHSRQERTDTLAK